jgi:Putative viral replication protein
MKLWRDPRLARNLSVSLVSITQAHFFDICIMAPSRTCCRWVATLNNWTVDEESHIATVFEGPRVKYGIIGSEVGENETPHLQMFFILEAPARLSWLRNNISARAHYEPARGTSAQAADYCKKDGEFVEFGEFPSEQGRRTDLERFRAWIADLGHVPSQRLLANEFPGLYLRYPRLMELAQHLVPQPNLVGDEAQLLEWQQHLDSILRLDPDDRKILFYVDPEGGKGKSWFVRHQVSLYPDETQFLSVGKRDDLAYAIDETKRVFLFDLPRGSIEHFQYTVLEKLKDQLVFSSKYSSRVKVLPVPVHVVVFCNEAPDMAAMTHDRYELMSFEGPFDD